MPFPIRPSLRVAAPARLLFACGVLVHVVLLLSLHFGWLNGLFNDSMHRFGPGADFFSIYAAGLKARHGLSVYTIDPGTMAVPYAYAFRYAPVAAYTLGVLLSLLPALTAYAAWLIVCEWTLLRNIRLTLEHAPNPATGYMAASLWLLFSPYYLELYTGQFTFVAASLVFWSYLAWSPKRAAGVPSRIGARTGDGLFAMAVWLKLMPTLFLPITLLRGRWKGAVATLLVLLATSWLYFARHPADWGAFRMINTDPIPTWHAGNQGLMALAYGLMNERIAPFLAFRVAAIAVVGTSLLWMTARAWQLRPGRGSSAAGSIAQRGAGADAFEARLLLLYAACTAAYLLLYKDVWEHHYVLLLPPLVLLALRRAPAGLWLPSFLLAAVPTLFVLYDVHGLGFNEDPQRYWRPAVSLLQHGLKPLSAIWLLAGAVGMSLPVFHLRPVQVKRAGSGRPAWTGVALGAPVIAACTVAACWAGGAIAEQRHGVRDRVWGPPIFQTQHHGNTCGPAALAAVCRYYGIAATEEEVAHASGTTDDGTSMLGLQRAAEQYGLTTVGRQVALPDLRHLPLPCILYFHPGHFAVLTGFDGDRYLLADPRSGQQSWTAGRLAHYWRGELLVVGPAETAATARLTRSRGVAEGTKRTTE
jgi:predicted double-glycine peptidase